MLTWNDFPRTKESFNLPNDSKNNEVVYSAAQFYHIYDIIRIAQRVNVRIVI